MVPCVCSSQAVSRSAKPPVSVVSGPHCNCKKAKEHYNNHQNCHYHKLCAAIFDNFVQTDKGVRKGWGLGLTPPPFELDILQNLYYLPKGN